ncbi:fatty acid oxidation complex subunit alpha FadJ [Aquisalimonas lutea]|uniref:fatty acid oxidation complex subunit alpha FadJ n=1 Tax=Aquisalimonas lutea TaxID=1327750 RepID=UPI0025B3B935|nr:fatty acid oxidation complex subunit alpha FadJ [Aquisalimonas lutea]MDN3517934.1 fatty acid oxidation complex subunit alpha FadJ [Aquisalimonas lutea]
MAATDAETGSMTSLSLHRRDDGIAVVTVDLPGESHNVLNRTLMAEAEQCADTLERDDSIQGVVFISGKADSFIAGADIEMLHACASAAEVTELSRAGQAFMDRIAGFRVPVVAAVNGACLGGGLELALACHGRVCTDADSTALGVPEVMLGLLPGGGGTQRLPRRVGIRAALDMALTGRQIRPHKARRMGLVDDVVPAPILEDAAVRRLQQLQGSRAGAGRRRSWLEWLLEGNPLGRRMVFDQARKQAQGRSRGNYPALPRIIECMETGLQRGLEAGLELEARRFGELAMTPQARQLMNIYFATTAMKKDAGTDAPSAAPRTIRRTAVLGAGLMGAGIAFVTTHKAGLPVRLKDIAADNLNKGLRHIHEQIRERRRRGGVTPFQADLQLNRVTPALDYSGFAGVDVAIEAVFEDLDLKHRMVRDVEAHAGDRTIFATNTSSIPITRIAEGAARPENVVGMHYFSPVEKMPLLEVIATEHTAPEVVATTVDLGRRQGKTVIVVRDGAGFYVNRILAPYINEACHLLREGVAIDRVDETLKNFGFPVGPFALLDEVGLDVTAKVAPILHEAFGERMKPVAEADAMLADGRYGKKSRKGFYRYDGKRRKGGKQVDESVYELLQVKPDNRASETEIVDRTVLLMVNEAARCHDEGVLRSLRDGDIGAVYGIGFPPFRGGPFRYMDARGIPAIVERLQALRDQHGERYAPAPVLERMAASGEGFHAD